MQFDQIDQIFLNHATLLERQGALHAVAMEAVSGPTATVESPGVNEPHGNAGPEQEQQMSLMQPEACEGSVSDDVLAMLLTAVPEQWETLAHRVVDARKKGHRIIGVAGHHAQEGRTTIVRGVAAVLRSLGWQVRCLRSSQELWRELTRGSGIVATAPGPAGVRRVAWRGRYHSR